ncbi:MAG TPA: hypothetical protein ENK15_01280, partial [Thermopetrobacter sp.]|nr:hypothetical protein [Thermopetrobacter sp.]
MPIIATFLNGYDDTGTPDNVTGTISSYDIVRFEVDATATTVGEYYFDMRITNFAFINEIQIFGTGLYPKTVDLSAAQLISGQGISYDLVVNSIGNPLSVEQVRVYMGNETSVSLTNWTFQDWGSNDNVIIVGDTDAEIIALSPVADQVYADDGDDTIVYTSGQDGLSGEIVDGGGGADTLQISFDTSATDTVTDLRDVNFTSIEGITFDAAEPTMDTTVQLKASEVKSLSSMARDLRIEGDDDPGNTETVQVYMVTTTTLDLSQWYFVNWGGQGDAVEILGDGSDETITGTAALDKIYAGAGDDTIRYLNGKDGDAGEIVDGGAGNDRVQIKIETGAPDTDFDLRTVDFRYIEELQFVVIPKLDSTLHLNAGQIGSGLSATMLIDGQYSVDTMESIEIHMDAVSVDLSGWTFLSWGGSWGGDIITILGDADAETITGSSLGDNIYGNGGADSLSGGGGDDLLDGGADADDMQGGAGDDTFRYVDGQDGDAGEGADGGAGSDTLWLSLASGAPDSTFDLRAVNFSSIENIQFTAGGDADATLSLNAAGIGAGFDANTSVAGDAGAANTET